MKKVNLNFPLKDLEGNVIDEGKALASKIAADRLAQGEYKEPIKMLDWCMQLYQTGEVTLDYTDFKAFKEAVNSLSLNILAKGQILKALDQAEETTTEAK